MSDRMTEAELGVLLELDDGGTLTKAESSLLREVLCLRRELDDAVDAVKRKHDEAWSWMKVADDRKIQLGAAQQTSAELRGELKRQPRDFFLWCPECGPEPRHDEDGCCAVCGATVGEVPDWKQAEQRGYERGRAEGLEEAVDAVDGAHDKDAVSVAFYVIDACKKAIRQLIPTGEGRKEST